MARAAGRAKEPPKRRPAPSPSKTPTPTPTPVDVPALVARATELRDNLRAKDVEAKATDDRIETLRVQRALRAEDTPEYERYLGYRVDGEGEAAIPGAVTHVEITNDPTRMASLRQDQRATDEISVGEAMGVLGGMFGVELPPNLPPSLVDGRAFLVNRLAGMNPPTRAAWRALIEIQALTDRLHEETARRVALGNDRQAIQGELTATEGRISAATATATVGDVEIRVNIDGAEVRLDGGSSSDAGPVYVFRDVVPGSHTISATRAGYEPAQVTIDVVAGRHVIVPLTMVRTGAPAGGTLTIDGVQHGRIRVDGAIYGEGDRRLDAVFRDGALAGYAIPGLAFGPHLVEFLDASGAMYSATQVTLADTADQRTAIVPFPVPPGEANATGTRVPVWGVLLIVTGLGTLTYFLARKG